MWQRVELASDSPESVELYTADYYYTNSRVNHQYQ